MLGSILIAVILIVLISLALWSIIKARRSGRHPSCGGCCSSCAQNYNCSIKEKMNVLNIQPFEMKNIPLVLDVVAPMWCPPLGDETFKRFNVEYIMRNNLFDNDFHYELLEQNEQTGADEFCAMAFFARKGDVCKAQEWFDVVSKKFPSDWLVASQMSRTYIELMDQKTFDMMNKDDIKLTLYVSRKKGCGSKLLRNVE